MYRFLFSYQIWSVSFSVGVIKAWMRYCSYASHIHLSVSALTDQCGMGLRLYQSLHRIWLFSASTTGGFRIQWQVLTTAAAESSLPLRLSSVWSLQFLVVKGFGARPSTQRLSLEDVLVLFCTRYREVKLALLWRCEFRFWSCHLVTANIWPWCLFCCTYVCCIS